MCVKPKPFTYSCSSCGWKKSIFPASDVLLPGEHYDCCPECGARPINREEIKGIAELGLRLLNKLFK